MRSLREKFKPNADFVKPLYRKVKFGNRVKPTKKLFVSVDINGDTKPCGDGLHVKRKVVTNKNVDYNVIELSGDRYFRSYCPILNKTYPKLDYKVRKNAPLTTYNLVTDYRKMEDENGIAYDSKSVQAKRSTVLIEKVPETWLRVYPAPQVSHESVLSVIFRCVMCQLGLATVLVLWNIFWVFIIHHFEGPYEMEVSIQFEKEQNQLVIDLATELRQITPLSPKWRNAIEKRIEYERQLTMEAVTRGAKLNIGQFWDLSGTFLFSVYVMTALGFGAPVPHTSWGRSSALIYAFLAVPTHIYLMVNASTCLVSNIESYVKKIRLLRSNIPIINNGRTASSESPNCSRESELIKNNLCRKIKQIFSILYLGRCVPCAMIVYYACGATAFGAVRGRSVLETAMFPLEFTTSGGLEHVESHVRILYGFYVEGAMMLLACALATLRAHSSDTVNYMSEKYRLFAINKG